MGLRLQPVRACSKLVDSRHPPILCYVTDRRTLDLPAVQGRLREFVNSIETVVAAGVDWIQIREKDLSARELTWVTRKILGFLRDDRAPTATWRHDARIIVNDRLDIALAERAGGVHLAENSLPVLGARRLVEMRSAGHDFLVGASCHSLEAAKLAESEGADYLFFGPIFATPSKARFGAPQGLERLTAVCDSVPLPVIAIGGITLENASPCVAAGAAGIAATRLFQEASDPASIVATLRSATNHRSE